jgi:hypothetical protein
MSKNYRKINKFSGTMLEQWRRVSSTHRNTGNINAMHFLSCYIFYASRLYKLFVGGSLCQKALVHEILYT